MSLNYQYNQEHIFISGHTYPHKTAIKALGARFQWDKKIWVLGYSEENLKKVELLCNGKSETSSLGFLHEQDQVERAVQKIHEAESIATTGQSANDSEMTVGQLLLKAQGVILGSFPQSVWIVGEIQNIQQRGRAVYFELAEADKNESRQSTLTVKGIVWQETKNRIIQFHGKEKAENVFQDGLKVRFLCQVQFYVGRGQLSLQVLNIDPSYTQGALALAREELLKELRKKGLVEKNRRNKLAKLPFRVGLLSAEGSRAESDFTQHLSDGGFAGTVYFVSCAMQGEKVTKDILAGIDLLVRNNCEMIVITRGGGSAADLRWFDLPELAYAIANCPIPVIAAIGHHDDTCVAESVCFQRQKTPTAAADFVLGQFQSVKSSLDQYAQFFTRHLTHNLNSFQEKTARVSEGLQFNTQEKLRQSEDSFRDLSLKIERVYVDCLSHLDKKIHRINSSIYDFSTKKIHTEELKFNRDLWPTLYQNAKDLIFKFSMRIEKENSRILAKDPMPWLKNGWTQIEVKNKRIKSVDQIDLKDSVKVRLIDGVLTLKLENKKKLKEIKG